MLPPGKRHQIHPPVAGDAANSLIDMDTVIEMGEIRQVMDSRPGDRLAGTIALAYGLQHGAIGPDLEVTIHTGLRGWNASEGRHLDRGVTIAAIDPKRVDVMLMAELHGLWASHFRLCHVWGALNDEQKPEERSDQEESAEDAYPGDGVGAWMKDLRHARTRARGVCQ